MADETLASLYEIRFKMQVADIALRQLGPLPPKIKETTRDAGRAIEYLIRRKETGADDPEAALTLLIDEFGDAPQAWRDRMAKIIIEADDPR